MPSHHSAAVVWLLAVALGLGCAPNHRDAQADSAQPASVDSLRQLGPRTIYYPTPPGAIEVSRHVVHGQVTERGCAFRDSSRTDGTSASWTVAYDMYSCTQVWAEGRVLSPVPEPPDFKAKKSKTAHSQRRSPK